MAFDKKTRKFSEEEKRLPRSRTDRSRSFDKSSKAYPAEREQHTSRGYQQFEYKNSLPERNRESNDSNNEYILTGRNPIREALKNHHDLEKLLVQKGELSGSAREIVQKAKNRRYRFRSLINPDLTRLPRIIRD